ncbi:MAG: pseudouridine synthase [Acidobacteria bacterium]|nr:pseudouridine synthase [Acidobacteriota bacterium]
MSEDRVQKLLARAGVASRRHVEDLIRAGRVTVNGQVAELGTKADPAKDAVKLDGKRISLAAVEPVYLLLHKPPAVMSTVEDPEGRPTVMDLVPVPLRKGLFPVGRLDFQTTGLLLLTNDGEFALKVSHPRYGCTKTYEVKVKGRPEAEKLDRLRRGISIDRKKTAPAIIEHRPLPRGVGSPDNSWWTVILNEGRTRQIREMFLRIGHPVQKLRRVAIGPLSDKGLPLGQIRELSLQEVKALLSPQARLEAHKPKAGKTARKAPAARDGARKGTARKDTGRSATASRGAAQAGTAGPKAGRGRSKAGSGTGSPARTGRGGTGASRRTGGPGTGRTSSGSTGGGRTAAARPGTAKPGAKKPSNGRPSTSRPSTGRPGSGRAVAEGKSSGARPTARKPSPAGGGSRRPSRPSSGPRKAGPGKGPRRGGAPSGGRAPKGAGGGGRRKG